MESLRLEKNDPCPCKSGKKFRQCCWPNRFRWLQDPPPVPKAPPSEAKTTVIHIPSSYPRGATFWAHPPGQPDAPPPEGGEWTDWYLVKDKGWTHKRDLKPGDQYRLKGGGWKAVPEPQLIESTQEHPFFVKGKGWTPLCEIKPGDEIRGEDGWVTVTDVESTNRWETVYNFRVANNHTYFVGSTAWGFAVWAHNAECVIRVEANGEHVLLDLLTGVEYARGNAAQVRQAALGVHTITDAPRLGLVQQAGHTPSGHPEFVQLVDETLPFQGRQFAQGLDEWTGGVLYPDHLGIGFTERLADVPLFTRGVEQLAGQRVTSVRGTASLAGIGDPPLLGDWIRSGTFQPDRLARRFNAELGGQWDVVVRLKNPSNATHGYVVEINRLAGT